ncbi:MAG: bifunctional diguanylate cyclase/phosphodiesterase [Lachnospiraceae bacterium]
MPKKKGHSALFSMVAAVIIIVCGQILLIGGAIKVSNVIPALSDHAYENFQKTVKNRKNYIESELHNRWSKIDDSATIISALYPETQEGNVLTEKETLHFLEQSTKPLLRTLRETGTTGIFLILNDNIMETSAHSCLYFVDGEPDYNDLKNNSDLLILKGPLEFLNEFKIPLHISWNYGITFTKENRDIFYKPYNAAKIGQNPKHLGYWDVSPSLYDDNANTITYTKPLLSPSGQVFGVLGVELSQEYIFKLLPSTELTGRAGGYAIATDCKDGGLQAAMVQGAEMRNRLPLGEKIKVKLENRVFEGYSIQSEEGEQLAVNYQKIALYDRNTPFEDKNLYLMGVTNQSSLEKNAKVLTKALSVALFGSLVIGILLSVLLSFFFTKPLQELIKKIRSFMPGQTLSLGATGILEIDELSKAVEQLNADVLNSALKTDKIIDMVNLDIGSYEYKSKDKFVKISLVLANMLGLQADEQGLVEKESFISCMREIRSHQTEEGLYQYGKELNRWLKIEKITTENGEVGVVVDRTKEERARLTLQHDRDFDALTGIYNRFAFWRKVNAIFAAGDFKYAGFVMGDLDNLKHLNDTYGHDLGDQYIKLMASFFAKYFAGKNAVFGRMSGDEFYFFLYGYDSIEDIRKIVYGLYLELAEELLILPDKTTFRYKMSSGVAWYPMDAEDAETLLRYADFAMYQGKHTTKGGIREFDPKLYQAQSYMVTGKEELNTILDEQLLEYVFQPIVSGVDGSLYGYEALMRPRGKKINSPDKLLNLAQAEGQLWKVEKNTFYMVMDLTKRYSELLKGTKIFLNSVPNQVLKEQEYQELAYVHKDILNSLVIEITENESIDEYPLQKKKSLAKLWGAKLAIDDYGSGYANDMLLLNMEPQFIKIDRFLIDGVDCDTNKLDIIKKTILFARERKISVIAEGVETEQELTVLLKAGVDYIQGYYVARPMTKPDFDTTAFKEKVREINELMK